MLSQLSLSALAGVIISLRIKDVFVHIICLILSSLDKRPGVTKRCKLREGFKRIAYKHDVTVFLRKVPVIE